MIKIVINVDNDGGEYGVKSDWRDDCAVYGSFNKAQSQRPSGCEHTISCWSRRWGKVRDPRMGYNEIPSRFTPRRAGKWYGRFPLIRRTILPIIH